MESVIEFDSAHLCRHGRSALPCPPDVGRPWTPSSFAEAAVAKPPSHWLWSREQL